MTTPTIIDLIDIPRLQRMTDYFFSVVGIPIAVIDKNNTVHVSSGWQNVCKTFYSANKGLASRCPNFEAISGSRKYVRPAFDCLCSINEIRVPVRIDSEQNITICFGQFLYENEEPEVKDYEDAAVHFGISGEEYRSMILSLPKVSRVKVNDTVNYFTDLLDMLIDDGLSYQRQLQMMDAYIENEKKFRKLIEQSYNGIAITDEQGRITLWNHSMEEITGIPATEVLYEHTWEMQYKYSPQALKTPEYYDYLKNIVEEFLRTGTSPIANQLKELIFKRTDGVEKYIQWYSFSIKTDLGFIIVSLHYDITEQKKAEELLKASETRLNQLVDASFEAIVITTQGKIIDANNNFMELFGFSLQEVAGLSIVSLLAEPEKNKIDRFLTQPSDYEYETICQKKGGSIFPAEIRIKCSEYKGEIVLVWAIRNITERKLFELELKSSKEKAEESDRLKSAFLANMSHEIRTPMNGIIGFAELLKDPAISEDERKGYVDIINSSSQQLLSIINDIIDISRIEAGQVKIAKIKTDLNQLIREIHAFFTPVAQLGELRLKFQTGLPDSGAVIRADSTKLHQIISNLVANALKFTPQGYVEFGYELKNDYLEFFVKDTGIGIKPESQKIIFERFRQAEPHIPGKKPVGTGLGLSICKAYVELMGGNIWLNSQTGYGTQFYFTIPYEKASFENHLTPAPDLATDLSVIKDLTILIAEDESMNFLFLKEILSLPNVEIIHAGNGEEAVEIIKSNPSVSLVLTDLKMPILDGYEATRIIKKLRPNLPVIAQTSYAMIGDREKALEAGCDEYIAKPISRDELYSLIRKVLKTEVSF